MFTGFHFFPSFGDAMMISWLQLLSESMIPETAAFPIYKEHETFCSRIRRDTFDTCSTATLVASKAVVAGPQVLHVAWISGHRNFKCSASLRTLEMAAHLSDRPELTQALIQSGGRSSEGDWQEALKYVELTLFCRTEFC